LDVQPNKIIHQEKKAFCTKIRCGQTAIVELRNKNMGELLKKASFKFFLKLKSILLNTQEI
jgi:hypothetical protein